MGGRKRECEDCQNNNETRTRCENSQGLILIAGLSLVIIPQRAVLWILLAGGPVRVVQMEQHSLHYHLPQHQSPNTKEL